MPGSVLVVGESGYCRGVVRKPGKGKIQEQGLWSKGREVGFAGKPLKSVSRAGEQV